MEDTTFLHRAYDYFKNGDLIEALRIAGESLSSDKEDKSGNTGMLYFLQGRIFSKLAEETEDSNLRCAYLFCAVESLSLCELILPEFRDSRYLYADSLFELGKLLESKEYYEKAMLKATEGLAINNPEDMLEQNKESTELLKKLLHELIRLAREKMDAERVFKLDSSRLTRKKEKEKSQKQKSVTAEAMRSFWAGTNVKDKRDFLKVNIEKFTRYVEGLYGRERKEALERGLEFAKTSKKWKLWMCPACSKEFRRSSEYMKHLQQGHFTRFRPASNDIVPQNMDNNWAEMMTAGDWKPVDTMAAGELLKNQLPAVKQFVYVNGWSKDWPSADDEDRRNLLNKIHQSLELLHKQKALPIKIQILFSEFAYTQFGQLGVPRQHLEECRFPHVPQCICFFGTPQLEQVQEYLDCFKTDATTDLLSKGADVFWETSRIKERIGFDKDSSHLLLDKRLLRGKLDAFDDEGTAEVCASSDHSARVTPQGDEIISWLLDCPRIEEKFKIHRPIREHNLGIWFPVSRIIGSKCESLKGKYHERWLLHSYGMALLKVKEICQKEAEGRTDITYSSLLLGKCRELLEEDIGISESSRTFLSAVADVLQGVNDPKIQDYNVEEYLLRISSLTEVDDTLLWKNWDQLILSSTKKAVLLDWEILMTDNSRNKLQNDLTRLSVFDYRSIIVPLLKGYLREKLKELIELDARARSAAAEATLLSDIKQEKNKKKKKKDKQIRQKEVDDKEEISTGAQLDQESEL